MDQNEINNGNLQQPVGMYYYPQMYPASYSYGAQMTQPVSVGANSNNKKENSSTGLTVLKVIATLLFIALTVGVGILAFKTYKKVDEALDNADKTLDNANNTLGKANTTLENANNEVKNIHQKVDDISKTVEDIGKNIKPENILNKQSSTGLEETHSKQNQIG